MGSEMCIRDRLCPVCLVKRLFLSLLGSEDNVIKNELFQKLRLDESLVNLPKVFPDVDTLAFNSYRLSLLQIVEILERRNDKKMMTKLLTGLDELRELLIKEIREALGDFNEILLPSEKIEGIIACRSYRELIDKYAQLKEFFKGVGEIYDPEYYTREIKRYREAFPQLKVNDIRLHDLLKELSEKYEFLEKELNEVMMSEIKSRGKYPELWKATYIMQTPSKRKLILLPLLIKPTKYYVVLYADGDSMGRVLSGTYRKIPGILKTFELIFGEEISHINEKLKEVRIISFSYHNMISRALMILANKFIDLIQEHCGVIIYSGGDDILALLPLNTVLNLVKEARRLYSQPYLELRGVKIPGLGPHLSQSYSAVLVHCMDPMYRTLEVAYKQLEEAKASIWSNEKNEIEKDTLVLVYLPRSGIPFRSYIPLNRDIFESSSGSFVIRRHASLLDEDYLLRFAYLIDHGIFSRTSIRDLLTHIRELPELKQKYLHNINDALRYLMLREVHTDKITIVNEFLIKPIMGRLVYRAVKKIKIFEPWRREKKITTLLFYEIMHLVNIMFEMGMKKWEHIS